MSPGSGGCGGDGCGGGGVEGGEWTPEEMNVAQNERQLNRPSSSPISTSIYWVKLEVSVFDTEWNGIGRAHRVIRFDGSVPIKELFITEVKTLYQFMKSRIDAWRRGHGGYTEGEGGRKLQIVRAVQNQKQDRVGEGQNGCGDYGCRGGSGFQ